MVTPRFARLALVCLALFCIAAVSASAAAPIYSTAVSDGSVSYCNAYMDGYNWDCYAQDRTSSTASAYYEYSSGVSPSYGSWWWHETSYDVIQFPTASLRGKNLRPNTVKLHIFCNSFGTPAPTVQLFGASFDGGGTLYQGKQGYEMAPMFDHLWNQTGTITYSQVNSCCANSTRRIAYVPISTTGEWHVVDVTIDLRRQIAAGYNWAGYFFSMNHLTGRETTDGFSLATYDDAAHRPYIEVTPEPSSLMALMVGITGLGGMLIRRRK